VGIHLVKKTYAMRRFRIRSKELHRVNKEQASPFHFVYFTSTILTNIFTATAHKPLGIRDDG
jgi:hypothetical protein